MDKQDKKVKALKKVGFIGTGKMGGALAKAVSKTDAYILLCDNFLKKAEELASLIGGKTENSIELVKTSDFIFLGVKPQVIDKAVLEIKDALKQNENAVLVSMAAGVSIEAIKSMLGFDMPIIRIMPNTAVEVGEGMILYATNEKVSEQIQNDFAELLKYAGKLDKINEGLIDAASAVSGCGPAFVYMFINALADGGVENGIPRDKALMYAEQTVLGAASLAIATGEHPEKLKDDVCSPGGTTIAGVHALEKGKMRASVMDAVKESYQKTLKIKK